METETALELTPAAQAVWEKWWMRHGREASLYDPDDLAAKIVRRLKTMDAEFEIGRVLTVEDIESAFNDLKNLGVIKPLHAEVRAARSAEAAREREFAAFYEAATSANIRKRAERDPEFRVFLEKTVRSETRHPDDSPVSAPQMFVIQRAEDGRYFAEMDGQGRPAWRAKVEHASRMGKTRSQVTAQALAAQGHEVQIVEA